MLCTSANFRTRRWMEVNENIFCADPPDTINSHLAMHLHSFQSRLDEDGGGPTPGGIGPRPPFRSCGGGIAPTRGRGAGGDDLRAASWVVPPGAVHLRGHLPHHRPPHRPRWRRPHRPIGGGGTIAAIGKEEPVVCRRVVETGRESRLGAKNRFFIFIYLPLFFVPTCLCDIFRS